MALGADNLPIEQPPDRIEVSIYGVQQVSLEILPRMMRELHPLIVAAEREPLQKGGVPRQGNNRRLCYADMHNSGRIPRQGTFRMASRAPRPHVGEPDHLVFLREDKTIYHRHAGSADSTRFVAWGVGSLMGQLVTQVETMLVLMA